MRKCSKNFRRYFVCYKVIIYKSKSNEAKLYAASCRRLVGTI